MTTKKERMYKQIEREKVGEKSNRWYGGDREYNGEKDRGERGCGLP